VTCDKNFFNLVRIDNLWTKEEKTYIFMSQCLFRYF
jgi:hypothetical protein